jgi:hypothetical protein
LRNWREDIVVPFFFLSEENLQVHPGQMNAGC